MNIELLNIDCMKYMKTCKDNQFDLAIVDPPYFNGPETGKYYRNGGLSKSGVAAGKYDKIENWVVPGKEYFEELIRVSKNQIIWALIITQNILNQQGGFFGIKITLVVVLVMVN